MRLVVDTNVFVSAALKDQSWPAETLRWVAANGQLLKSNATETEIFAVLARPRIASKIVPRFVDGLREIFANAILVVISEYVVACRDPKDDMFLELAVNGRADLNISGDADLLAMTAFQDIPIIAPAVFAYLRTRQG